MKQEPTNKNDLRIAYISRRSVIDELKNMPQESGIEWPHKPCINYEDGCEEWAGCPCVYYKAESEEQPDD